MTRTDDTRGDRGRARLDALFACLANGDSRRILGFLYDQAPDSLTQRDLASHLVNRPTGHEADADTTVSQALLRVRHTLVPKLDAAGLVVPEPDHGTVALSDHPAFEDRGIVDVISGEEDADADSLDALFRVLSVGRRRTALDVLSHEFQEIHVETLAREVAATERGVAGQAVPGEDVAAIRQTLFHVHLPLMDDAGVVEYDPDARTVAYAGHPALRVPWMHSVLGPHFRALVTTDSTPREMGHIQGREDVISYGQWLGERTEEELFCMFTHTDMLESGCFRRVIDAAAQGVDVYIGTYDTTVRSYVREHAPEVTLWEPRTNWLSLPVEGNRVGRLILSDRRAVMLGTIKTETDDGVPEEKAIVGEGADNTLVVMIRQMLDGHLDQIDEQYSELAPTLPF